VVEVVVLVLCLQVAARLTTQAVLVAVAVALHISQPQFYQVKQSALR
jgi:hypothetical protein